MLRVKNAFDLTPYRSSQCADNLQNERIVRDGKEHLRVFDPVWPHGAANGCRDLRQQEQIVVLRQTEHAAFLSNTPADGAGQP